MFMLQCTVFIRRAIGNSKNMHSAYIEITLSRNDAFVEVKSSVNKARIVPRSLRMKV